LTSRKSDRARSDTTPELRRVLVAIDFSETAAAAVPFAYALAGRGGSVILVHVIEPMTAPNPLYAHYSPGRAPTAKERKAQEAELRERLRDLAPADAEARGVATEVDVVSGREVASCILEAAARHRADAICISSHGRSGLSRTWLGSVAEDLLRRAPRPTLIVPSPRA
jgi:nucleotide-binding universal stress UspA family protein